MDTIERYCAPIAERASRDAAIGATEYKPNTIALRPGLRGSSLAWAIHLLPVQRRKAATALYDFCREIDDIANGEATHSLKQILFLNWRSEVAALYAGRPRHSVTLGLSKAIHLYGLRCNDFLAIIDGMEMDALSDVRSPSLAQLDYYCERVAVAKSRLSMRIFGNETPAGECIAAELGRALQFTRILRDLAADAKRHRLYLPRELLHSRGIFATTPSWVLAQPTLPEVCSDLAILAERHYAAAADAIAVCPRRTMRLAAVMLGVNHALLCALVARGWRELDEPVRIPPWRELALVIRHGLAGR
jgi:phytoene synthase